MANISRKKNLTTGFSLIEMVVGMTIAAMLTFALGAFWANGQRSWNNLFGRVYGDTAIDGFTAHKVFDSICRKASLKKYVIGDDADTLEVYYWDSGSSASTPENYAQFFLLEDGLYVQHGNLRSGSWQPDEAAAETPIKIAGQINSVKFEALGTSMQMYLTYADENAMPVVCSTVRHND